MTERTRAELDTMRRRMEAAHDKEADIRNFFAALTIQPEDIADHLWTQADRRLTDYETGARPLLALARLRLPTVKRKRSRKLWFRRR